jgi:signal transduction histidine kinase
MGSNSSVILLALIEDILDLSKMEAGTFSVSITHFSLPELLDELYDIFAEQCQQKGLKLKLKIDPRLKRDEINSDRGRIKQIMLNLLSNAYKFTFNGSISISADLLIKQGKSSVQISVEDTGIGVKEESQSQLFQLFSKLPTDSNLNPHG